MKEPKDRGVCHVAEMCIGPLYSYLGHFADEDFLKDGHNTDDATSMDKFYEQMYQGVAPK